MPTSPGTKDDRRPVSVSRDRSVTIASRARVLLGALALVACSSTEPAETSPDAGDAATANLDAELDADRPAVDAATVELGSGDRPGDDVAADAPAGDSSSMSR